MGEAKPAKQPLTKYIKFISLSDHNDEANNLSQMGKLRKERFICNIDVKYHCYRVFLGYLVFGKHYTLDIWPVHQSHFVLQKNLKMHQLPQNVGANFR